jgi:hypothetical protein
VIFNYMKNLNGEVNRIKNLFEGKLGNVKPLLVETSKFRNDDSVVITDWLSPDEKYIIFLDELYDLKEKKKYGDVWENTSNLIMFLEHTYKVSNLNETIKEHASNVFSKILITENVIDLSSQKQKIKDLLLSEISFPSWSDVGSSAKNWAKGAWDRTVTGIKDFGSDVASGVKKVGSAIASGDWNQVLDLLKKGAHYLARKIRQAVYSEAGMIIDTILIVTGIGKVAQFVVWAIVVALDIYEFTTGDYEHKEDPMWLRIIFFVIDIIGLVFAGVAAKAARTAAKTAAVGVRTAEQGALAISKSPVLKSALVTGTEALAKGSKKMTEAGVKLGTGKLGSWFGSMLGKMGSFFKYLGENLAKLLSWKAVKGAAKTTAIVGGIGTGIELYKDMTKKDIEKQSLAKQELSKSEEDDLIKAMKNQKDVDITEYL